MIFRFPRRIFGVLLIISGMVIFEFPDLIQYALAVRLVFSVGMMLLGLLVGDNDIMSTEVSDAVAVRKQAL